MRTVVARQACRLAQVESRRPEFAVRSRRMMRLVALALVGSLGCDTPTPTTAADVKSIAAGPTGYPWQRLVIAGNPVEPLALELPEAALRELGVKSHRSYAATSPRIWLLAFEFADQQALFAAEPRVLAALGDGGPPYARKTSHTGAWLLVTGFPTDGEVSRELDHARGAFRDSWAGEE